jgi:hypothetical protein
MTHSHPYHGPCPPYRARTTMRRRFHPTEPAPSSAATRRSKHHTTQAQQAPRPAGRPLKEGLQP